VNREHVTSGLLALLATLAIGGIAASLDARRGGTGAGGGGGSGVGIGENPRFSLGGGGISFEASEAVLPDWLAAVLGVAVLLVAIYGIYELYREYGLRRIVEAAAAGVVMTVLLYGFMLLLRSTDDGIGVGRSDSRPSLPAGGTDSTAEQVTRAVDPPTALLVALGVVLLGAVALIIRATGDQTVDIDAVPAVGENAPGDVAAIADAAGRAADRIDDDADLDNTVFRAWREMTADLAVDNPESSTPAEFADAAVAAGMAPDDVAELTELFEDVRYGDRPVTEERAARARTALRRIEETYGDGVPTDATDRGADGHGTGGDDV
jgi:hypothetical protein